MPGNIDYHSPRDAWKFLGPILLTVVLASILTFSVKIAYYPGEDDTPPDISPIPPPDNPSENPEETIVAGLANAILYVLIALIGGIFLVFMIRSGRIRILELLFALLMGFTTFVFVTYILPALTYIVLVSIPNLAQFLSEELATFILFDLTFYFGVILGILSFLVLGLSRFKSPFLHNSLMISFGAMMGTVFGVHFAVETLFFVLLALALYDIYAVFYGPIKHMFGPRMEAIDNQEEMITNSSVDNPLAPKASKVEFRQSSLNINDRLLMPSKAANMRPMSPISLPVYQTQDISIGLGDFVFFSVLIGKSVFEGLGTSNSWFFVLPFLGIMIGAYATFRLLERNEILPALPLPIFCGTAGFVIALVLGNLTL